MLLGKDVDMLPVVNSDGSVMDDLPEDAVNYSFLVLGRKCFSKGQCLMLLYLLEDETRSAEFYEGGYGNSIIWHHTRLDRCTHVGAGFMDMIGPLIHLTYGRPARRPELVVSRIVTRPTA